MKAAVITGPGLVGVETVPDPAVGPGEVVLAVAAVGLCGTDLHLLAGTHAALPVVPGHEVSGTVVAIDRTVTGLAVGDRVVVDPNLPCRSCRSCRAGRGNLCRSLQALGITLPGGAAEYLAAPWQSCVRLPDEIDLEAATLIEPLSCAVRGYDVLAARLGSTVLVYGAGTMGLMMLELAKRTGATSVHVVELDERRRDHARELGCSAVAARAADFGWDEGWDVVVEATGNVAAIRDGLEQVGPGGTFLQFGVSDPQARVELSPYRIYRHEITVTGSMAVLHSFQRAVDLFAAGVVDPAAFITSRTPLAGYASALAGVARGEGLKAQVLPAR